MNTESTLQRKIINPCTCTLAIVFILFVAYVIPAKAQPLVFKKNTVEAPVIRDTYEKTASDYKASRNDKDRNRLIFMAISQIDLEFEHYIRKKRHRNTLFQTIVDILEVGAATAISITNGERAKSVIADALGFVQGSRARANKNLRLLEQQVLVNKMIENRAKILTEIYKNIDKSDTQYPFERAYIDILAYYRAGTTDSALSSLALDTGTSATVAERGLDDAKRKAGIMGPPTAEQVRMSRENAKFVQSLIDSYQTATDSEAKTVALGKLKDIFTSIKQDLVLKQLLYELPKVFPELGTEITSQLKSIEDGKGTIEDYGFTLLRFFSHVTEIAPANPEIVERVKNTVDSVK